MVFIFGKFSPKVTLKVIHHPVTELELAEQATVLMDRYDPTLIMGSPQTTYPDIKEEMLRYRSDGFDLVNWHVAMVDERQFQGANRWEETAYYATV